MSDRCRLDEATLDGVLEAVLRQNPTALVMAMDEHGSRVPFPSSIRGAEHRTAPESGSLQELVTARDWPTVNKAWAQALDVGGALASVHLASDEAHRAALLFVDARHRYGVLVCVAAGAQDHILPDLQQALLRTRFCSAQKDEFGVFLSVDAATTQVLGWAAEELVGKPTLSLIHPDDASTAIACWMDLLTVPGAERRFRARHRHRDGSWVWLEVTNRNLLDGSERCVVADMFDVGDEIATEEALRASEQSLLRLADALPLGVLQIDREHRVLYRNERLSHIVGRRSGATAEELLSNVASTDRARLDAALIAAIERAQDDDIEIAVLHQRSLRHCSVAVRALPGKNGTVSGAILCVADVTEDVRLRQELRDRATYDRLTHCYNRASILSSLDSRLLEACLNETGTGAIFIDLDHFKPINDELGHAAGDMLLCRVAERLLRSVRPEDRVGRMGGDEFLVVCPNLKVPEDALAIAERLANALGQPLEINGRPIVPSASIGVSWSRNGSDNADALVARADAAMYRSKSDRQGRPVLATKPPPSAAFGSSRANGFGSVGISSADGEQFPKPSTPA